MPVTYFILERVESPTGEICENFHVLAPVFGIDGNYKFVDFDDSGFPIFKYTGLTVDMKDHHVYVYQTSDSLYWHFSYVAGDSKAWLYSPYTQNCPGKENQNSWFSWEDSAWSKRSPVTFEIL